MSIRIVIADDHTIFRHGLRALLERFGDFPVVGEASDGPETLKRLTEVEADVLVLDLSMPGGMSGARIAEEALKAHPGLAIVVLTMHQDEYYLREMLAVGARAFVIKNSAPENLAAAIRAAHGREYYVDSSLAGHTVSAFLGRPAAKGGKRVDVLTPREQEVCRLLALGHTNGEVGKKLHISERTVESHRMKIIERLGIKNRAELVQFAMDNGLLTTR
ncbi:MAG: response regulator transcription factor [Deltaproteobacteria bacterium]|nr:response regulator transcription factor [Deltaproteobacteria bacterium]